MAPEHKGGVFDLVGQILHAAIADVNVLAKDEAMTSRQVLERSLAFALALEHTQHVAVPAEVKTQVMKHAALLDAELLSRSTNDLTSLKCHLSSFTSQSLLLSILYTYNRTFNNIIHH